MYAYAISGFRGSPKRGNRARDMTLELGGITLVVNGESTRAPAGATVRDLLAQLGLQGPVAAEVNGQIVVRVKHAECTLNDGDVLELVHFVGGG